MAMCADIAGAGLPANAAEDSYSLLPILLNPSSEKWHRPDVINHSINGTFAIRSGKWKLIAGSGSGGRGKPGSRPWSKPYQLYGLDADPSERNNLVEKYPEIVKNLSKKLKIMKSGRSVVR